jgi:hypothetical protein
MSFSIYIYLCQIQNVFSMCGSVQGKSGGPCNKRSTATGDRVVMAAETTFQASTLLRWYLCLIFLVCILRHLFCMLSILHVTVKICFWVCVCVCECLCLHACVSTRTCMCAYTATPVSTHLSLWIRWLIFTKVDINSISLEPTPMLYPSISYYSYKHMQDSCTCVGGK